MSSPKHLQSPVRHLVASPTRTVSPSRHIKKTSSDSEEKFYCVRCRASVMAHPAGVAHYTNSKTGRVTYALRAVCPVDGHKTHLTKFISQDKVEASVAMYGKSAIRSSPKKKRASPKKKSASPKKKRAARKSA